MKIININTKEILEVEQEHLIAILKNNKDYKIYNQETKLFENKATKENSQHWNINDFNVVRVRKIVKFK